LSETRRFLLEFETERVSSLARKDRRVREELIKAFSDVSETVRERALIAAMDLGDPSVVDEVVKALSDEEEDVRIAAAQVLAWYHQPRTIPHLLKGLKDSSPWVRSHCAVGLSKLMNGPIWARLKEDVIDKFIEAFPDMEDDEIRNFMLDLGIRADSIDRYLRWRAANFDVEIDMSVIEEMEAGPIILAGTEGAAPEIAMSTHTGLSLAPEVEEILAELPRDTLENLPSEDLRRLTPETARELVDSLLEGKKPKKKKKKVKVRKVKRVRKVRKRHTREELLAKIPPEVRESVGEEALSILSIEELEALVATPGETTETVAETAEEAVPAEPTKKKRKTKKEKLLEKLPPEVRASLTEEDIERLSTRDLEKMIEAAKSTTPAELPEDEDERRRVLAEKYGEERAEILVMIPPDMLVGIPEEQIQEMDLDTLRDLTRALAPPKEGD